MTVPEKLGWGAVRRAVALGVVAAELGVGLGVAGLGVGLGVVAQGQAKGDKPARADRQARPSLQLPLEKLGFPGVSAVFLSSGSSMLTVHFMDSGHLLVTFSLRTLVPRIVGDPEEDDDRLVAAEVVELPSGAVTARTEWHMHDHGRYLWSLGGGRFLVRIGDRLYSIDPLGRLGSADPFARTPFPSRPLKPSLVFVSPDAGVVTLESVVALPGQEKRTVLFGDKDAATANRPQTRTLIDFFRVKEMQDEAGSQGEPLRVVAAGNVLAPEPLVLPINMDGYLWTEETGNHRWGVSFNEFGGKAVELGVIDSTCQPRLQMVSRSEFLAFTCKGSDERVKMASYGFDGQETWEETFGDLGVPTLAYAPAAGRFAISHTIAATPGSPVAGTGQTIAEKQEVRVYQNASGDLVLKVECSPVVKIAENFDLSADGLMAAVIQSGAIAIYKLPPPGKKDVEDMAEVARFAPPASSAPVTLARLEKRPAGGTRSAGKTPSIAPAAAAATADVDGEGATSDAAADGMLGREGSPAQEGPAGPSRKPPTLLKPGEKAEFQDKKERPGAGRPGGGKPE